MITKIQFIHVCISLIIAFSYLYLQIQLIQNNLILVSILLFFSLCFMKYAVACYLIFHTGPGYEDPRTRTEQNSVDHLFQYKNNQQRRQAILQQLSDKNNKEIDHATKKCLEEQLAILYTKNSYCEICQFLKAPRTYHCTQCNKCVQRMQYHCAFLSTCIGQRNHKIFIQYLISGLLCTLYISISCLICMLVYKFNLQVWPVYKKHCYKILCAGNFIIFGILLYLFSQSLINIKKNVTEIQKKLFYLINKNPFSYEDYYHKLFPKVLDYFNLVYSPQFLEIEFIQERQGEQHS